MLSTPVRPLAWKTPAAMISIAMLTSPAIVMAITTSTRSNRKIRRRCSSRSADDAPLRQRGVQVDDVRHHGRAEDAGCQQDALGAVEAGHEAVRDAGRRGVGMEHLEGEADDDHADQADDGGLHVTEPAAVWSASSANATRR